MMCTASIRDWWGCLPSTAASETWQRISPRRRLCDCVGDWRQVANLLCPEAWLYRVASTSLIRTTDERPSRPKVKALLRGRTVDTDILPHDVESLEPCCTR